MSESYYKEVGAYYDEDATSGFEARAEENQSLQRIRNSFREVAAKYAKETALEIGCGPGYDALWYGATFPNSRITAVDVSKEMVSTAGRRTIELSNVTVIQSTEKDLADLPNAPFDLCFVFFGALNTVESLPKAAESIYGALQPGGVAVLTFVNKWYLRELIVNLLKLRWKTAFARIRKVWGGYSPQRHLASSCYAPNQVRKAFASFKEFDHRGFSIVYPAWYNDHKIKHDQAKADRLWNKDEALNAGPFWKFGEYTLFVFQKPE